MSTQLISVCRLSPYYIIACRTDIPVQNVLKCEMKCPRKEQRRTPLDFPLDFDRDKTMHWLSHVVLSLSQRHAYALASVDAVALYYAAVELHCKALSCMQCYIEGWIPALLDCFPTLHSKREHGRLTENKGTRRPEDTGTTDQDPKHAESRARGGCVLRRQHPQRRRYAMGGRKRISVRMFGVG